MLTNTPTRLRNRLNVIPYSQVAFGTNNGNISANQAIERLKRGNQRFILDSPQRPNSNLARVKELKNSQHPFAATLSCSDSRVSPDIIFDQGLGDIFEVRNAGNVPDKSAIGSLEYAVSHLGVNLIVVMGHDDCGAVKTAAKNKKQKSIYINDITHYIYPSVKESKKIPTWIGATAEEENCNRTVKKLMASSKILSNAVKNNGLKIVPAMYDIESGHVEFN